MGNTLRRGNNERTSLVRRANGLMSDSDDEGDVPPLLNAPPPTPANQPVKAPKKAAQPAVTPPAANWPHKAGDLATVDGLVSKPEINGREARITGYDEAKARFAVELLDAGTRLSLKGANLIASRPPASLLKVPSWWCRSCLALPSAWFSRLLTALLTLGTNRSAVQGPMGG
jgi:hypothetical protein